MAKQQRNRGRRGRKRDRYRDGAGDAVVIDLNSYAPQHGRGKHQERGRSLIDARTRAQGQYMAAIKTSQLVFGIGPAGTGKTYCATAMAAEALLHGECRRIIISRPLVTAGETPGYLPGRLSDKLEPWFSTLRGYLCDLLGRGAVECAIKNERIRFEPLAYLRGSTFEDAFVILDEAQNCTRGQLKMFLTRIGEDARVVINGDPLQSDIGRGCGLRDAATRLQGLPDISILEFDHADVVRSRLVRNILERYNTA